MKSPPHPSPRAGEKGWCLRVSVSKTKGQTDGEEGEETKAITSQPSCPPHPRGLSEAPAVMSQSITLGSGQPVVITPGTCHYAEGHRGTSGVTQCVPVLNPRNPATQGALGPLVSGDQAAHSKSSP